jgi:hypothetical protein
MAPQSDKLAGSLDIARLLDLLNTAEGQDESTDRMLTALAGHGAALQQMEGSDAVPPDIPPVEPDPAALSTHQQEATENRFAAHVVSGMSKLKRP